MKIFKMEMALPEGLYNASVQGCLPYTWKLSINSTRKWMRLAKAVKEIENPCHSRAIGAILVDPDADALISSGHNGPPSGCLSNDNPDYLRKVVWPQLTEEERKTALPSVEPNCDLYCSTYGNNKICPRKPINAPSGKRLELCNCIHGEVDAICKAKASGGRIAGSYMFAYCGVPCADCTKIIINSKVDCVMAIAHDHGDYSPYSSRFNFEKSQVRLFLVPEEWIWKE